MHALKASEKEFNGFQEAYFSMIKKDNIKAWKKTFKNDNESYSSNRICNVRFL